MSEPLSHTVLEAVAELEGAPPAELSYPLFDAVNPEALDGLFRETTGHVVFSYHGYGVTVFSDGAVDVTPVEE